MSQCTRTGSMKYYQQKSCRITFTHRLPNRIQITLAITVNQATQTLSNVQLY